MSPSVDRFEETEQEAVRAVASRYQKRGYDVVREPAREILPKPLRRFQPDLIARGPHETVVVEVKSRSSLGKDPRLAEFARTVERIPGWRFELVVANPEIESSVPLDERSLTKREILRRLDEAARLEADGHREAALLLAWSAAEAALRHKSRACGIKPDGQSGMSIAKSLYSIGEIAKSTFDDLTDMFHLRNSLVHGFRAERPIQTRIERFETEIKKLVSNGRATQEQ